MFVLIAGSAMLRTSTTFDEIVFPAVGARGLATGDFSMVSDHPRLPQYLLGLPLYLSGVRYPPEHGHLEWTFATRYQYAQYLYAVAGNSTEEVTLVTRLVGLAFGALTVLATFLLARRHMPEPAALLAATLLAFLPDVLAHSGIAYNDVPLTFGVLVSVYALDALVRRPTWGGAVVAGVAFAFTACMKYSGLIVLPIAVSLAALEWLARRDDRAWRTDLARSAGVFAVVGYVVVVAVYCGDWRLAEYLEGLRQISASVQVGRPSFLLGELRTGGWWYFFPVAFALKTPLGLHVLIAVALLAGLAAARQGAWRKLASHGMRAPAVALVLLLAATLASRLNIGMRHALPLLPFACILIAQGTAWTWRRGAKVARAVVAVAFVAFVASTLRAYPYFLSYLSEYAYGRPIHETLVDSNTDWGQGLVALRAYMRQNGIERVHLGYFGSAVPQAYGIAYVPMPSYFQLPPGERGARPRFAVVSATLLAGMYVFGDPYAPMREEKPVAVVGGSLYVFDTQTFGRR